MPSENARKKAQEWEAKKASFKPRAEFERSNNKLVNLPPDVIDLALDLPQRRCNDLLGSYILYSYFEVDLFEPRSKQEASLWKSIRGTADRFIVKKRNGLAKKKGNKKGNSPSQVPMKDTNIVGLVGTNTGTSTGANTDLPAKTSDLAASHTIPNHTNPIHTNPLPLSNQMNAEEARTYEQGLIKLERMREERKKNG